MKKQMIQEAKRSRIIDIMRGIGIICMVSGHAGGPFTHFIYLFHMSLFFMVSGYLFKAEYSDSFYGMQRFIRKKIKSLYIPYVICEVLFSLSHNLLIRLNIYTDNESLLNCVPERYASVAVCWTAKDTAVEIFKNIFLGTGSQLGGGLWFVANLFEISILFCCIDFIGKRYLKGKNYLYFQAAVSIVFLFLGYGCSIYGIKFNGAQRVFSYYILFYLGYLSRNLWPPEFDRGGVKTHILRFAAAWCSLLILNRIGYIDLVDNEYINPVYLVICSICGGVFIYEIAAAVERQKLLAGILSRLGRDTLSILMLHFLCFKIVNYVGVLMEKKPLYLVAAFPVLYTEGCIWLIYTIVGLAVPVFSKAWKDKIAIHYRMIERHNDYGVGKKNFMN